MAYRRVYQVPWLEIKKELFANYPLCQYRKIESATQLAHALYHKRYLNNAKRSKIISVRKNALPCGDNCQKFSETHEGRRHAWKMLCEREGLEEMNEWHDNLDLIIKERFI